MDAINEHAWQWLALLALLCCSGFFSGTETALFSLSRHDLHVMRRAGRRTERLAANLMADPRRLLATLLIGNNTVNVLIFANSYVLMRHVAGELGPAAASLCGIVSLLVVIVFGEIVPKVIAAAGATKVSPRIAPIICGFQIVISPVRAVLEWVFVIPLMRLIGRPALHSPYVTADELKTLLEMSRKDGVIDPPESGWLQQVVDLAEVRVREVMVPRLEASAFDVDRSTDELLTLMRETRFTKIPVYDDDLDHVIGLVYARDVIRRPERALRELVRDVRFVPEQMRLEQLLSHFRDTGTQLAVVVDEYGGMSGLVTLEDVAEHIVGDIRDDDLPPDRPEIEPLADGEFSVAGRLSVRTLVRAFGPDVLDEPVATIAGLCIAKLGRIPRQGDEIALGNLVLTVESMVGRRVDRVRLRLADEPTEEGGEPR